MSFISSTLAKIDPFGNRAGLYGKDVGKPIDPLGNAIEDSMAAPPPPTAGMPGAAPTMDNSNADLDLAAQKAARSMQGGRTSTMLGGGRGFDDSRNTFKILLGQ